MSNNDYYLHRPGFNPSSRATYTIFHPSTNNFYTTMSVGRALLLNPDLYRAFPCGNKICKHIDFHHLFICIL